jgi:hypothetical protein
MKKVAKDLDMHFEKQVKKGMRKTKQEDNSVGTMLARRWLRMLEFCTGTHGNITPRELLGCCEDIDELDLVEEFGWVQAGVLQYLSRGVPDAYMFKQRLTELYLNRQHMERGFVLRAAEFFFTCCAYSVFRAWFGLVATILQIRVVLCFASHLPLIGRCIYPFCTIAEQVFDWKEDHWLLGCLEIDEQDSSVISMVPIWFNRQVLLGLLCRPEFISGCLALLWCKRCRIIHRRFLTFVAVAAACALGNIAEFYLEEFPSTLLEDMLIKQDFSKYVRFTLELISDFLFTSYLCSLDRNVLQKADDVIHPKLVLMSMKLGSLAKQSAKHKA